MTENGGVYMPMDFSRYPENWLQFTLNIRDSKDWSCENCGKQCRKTGELLSDFILRIWGNKQGQLVGNDWKEAVDFPKRFSLTSAHLDQNPSNNHPANLKALCTVCHLQYDHPHFKSNAIAKQERIGQRKLPI
jgi:hypothetical protein